MLHTKYQGSRPCGFRQDFSGIILGEDSERFAHFSAKNLIEIGLMGEKSNRKM